ncbi:acyl-CoA dehydrogenase family protein [Paraconexibacter algicola]|uniref:Acyl-CoA dehydrogenase n=1 Tax=Paraconexibacter algicola TaxID=2133960 RepID=A0A2T4UGK9_9ACTN|nr:acyl-CoA dehydrogenase family protein [Paraconexibacter algicola]PTL58348.1 acyl-CoA dehydrogenase [Paraconexibacter algicola]
MSTPTAAEPVIRLVPTQEQEMLRESVAGVTAKYGAKYMLDCHERGVPPTEMWDALSEKGFTGVNIPEEYGGGGLGMTGLALVQEELGRHGCTQLLMVVSPAIAGSILMLHGDEEQKDRWLPGLATGTERISFAVTEPDAGTNTHNITTRARRNDDGTWTLRGQKTYISAVEHATALLVVARRELEDGSLGLPLLFIIDLDSPGFSKENIPTALRLPDKQWTLYFDDVQVPEERLIGGDQGGLGALFDGLNPERIMAAAGSLGAADRALTKAAEYANERVVWGKPIGTHQGLSHPLAQCKIELELARLMNQKACALYDAGWKGAGETANMAKYAAAEACVHAVDQAIQTHGGNGIALEYGLSDMWWGARLNKIAPVSREMILNYVAEHSLGLPKSY